MKKVEEIAYNYLDTIYSNYRKTGRRASGRPLESQVIYMFVEDKDLKNPAFEWDWIDAEIKMKKSDYTTLTHMFSLDPYQVLKVMRLFVSHKTGDDKVMNPNTRVSLEFFRE
jgi:hypothetical protein